MGGRLEETSGTFGRVKTDTAGDGRLLLGSLEVLGAAGGAEDSAGGRSVSGPLADSDWTRRAVGCFCS